MDARIKKLWVDALRSGDYAQGRYKLREDDRFCCLGVLCELAVQEGAITRYSGHREFLPQKVQKWAGLSTKDGAFKPDDSLDTRRTLSLLNDEPRPFTEIAKTIERYF